MTDTAGDAKLARDRIPANADGALHWNKAVRWIARFNAYDIATALLLAALVIIAFCTFKDYAISNDEVPQHHYGELIINYYASGFKDQGVFNFENLYLYGGLFDIVAVALSHVIPIDAFDLRHIMCVLMGIGGIFAAAATARLIAGPRAALITALSLSVCGAWYGSMFNHTKDVPFASAMIGAAFFLIRIARLLPSPRTKDLVAFGLLAGAALGVRVLGLLLVVYAAAAIALYLPRPWFGNAPAQWRFMTQSGLRILPALALAYALMILAWPWAALAPLNPVRGLLAFSEFHYTIRTMLDGQVYEMANVPPLYVPIYILIRVPLLTLFGAALALMFALLRFLAANPKKLPRREIALIALMVIFPLTCQVICHGPAFTGLRHFLFVVPAIAVLAGIGLDVGLSALATRGRTWVATALAVVTACFVWDAVTLVRLHPYQYLFYNAAVGGLEGASRRYDLDYWFASMPEALGELEIYLRHTSATDKDWQSKIYSVAVCGDQLEFEKKVTLPQLRFDFKPTWEESEFFIAPTNMNCDQDLDGKVVGTVTRLGVPIAYVKDRRALTSSAATVDTGHPANR